MNNASVEHCILIKNVPYSIIVVSWLSLTLLSFNITCLRHVFVDFLLWFLITNLSCFLRLS